MELNTKNIAESIRKQIGNYKQEVSIDDIGYVETVGDGIAIVSGLENVMANELLLFNGSVYGMALNLEAEQVGAVILSSDNSVKAGDPVKRTNRVVEVPVGDAL